MASKDRVDFDLSTLRGFVSDSIIQFLSEDNANLFTSKLQFVSNSPTTLPYNDELNVLLLECSDYYKENSKRPRLLRPSKRSKPRVFAPIKSMEEME